MAFASPAHADGVLPTNVSDAAPNDKPMHMAHSIGIPSQLSCATMLNIVEGQYQE